MTDPITADYSLRPSELAEGASLIACGNRESDRAVDFRPPILSYCI